MKRLSVLIIITTITPEGIVMFVFLSSWLCTEVFNRILHSYDIHLNSMLKYCVWCGGSLYLFSIWVTDLELIVIGSLGLVTEGVNYGMSRLRNKNV